LFPNKRTGEILSGTRIVEQQRGDMDVQVIYVKTEKAADEIHNRTHNLTQKMRSLLIMIDGTKAVGSYMEFSKVLGDVTSMLTELERQGFINKQVQTVPEPQQPEQPAQGKLQETLSAYLNLLGDERRE
jgi:hypothetical protein